MKLMVYEACKQFRSRWVSALFSALGIMVASISMVVVSHVSSMYIQNVIDTIMINGGLSFVVHLQNPDYPLNPDELDLVFADIPHVTSYNPLSDGNTSIGKDNISVLAISDYDKLFDIELISGQTFSEQDIYPHVILTKSLEKGLKDKGYDTTLNTPIFTNDGVVSAIGVIEDIKLPQGVGNGSDQVALLSHHTFSTLFKRSPSKVIVTIDDIEFSDEVVLNIQGKFQQLYPQVPIHTMSPKLFIDITTSITDTSHLVSIILMAVCAVLGGIGIMNMIIANINERKSELALRVAFGASMNEIRNMLVTETCILCLSAGLVGVAVGLGITMIIASMAGLTLVIQWATLIKSLVFCTFVGVAASQYPSHLVKRIPVAYLLKGE